MSNEKYLNKVTSQHKTKPKFMAWLEKNLDPIDGAYSVLGEMDSAFDIYNAIGKQQDMLGHNIGRSRSLDFQPADGSNPRLEDDLYRIVQLAKISINQWDGTIPGVVELWKSLFPDYKIIIQDNQDMSMNLSIIGLTSTFEKELMSKGYIAPKPQGVRLKYEFYSHLYRVENPLFFYANAGIYQYYKINSKAVIASDTSLSTKLYLADKKKAIKHITIGSKANPENMNLISNVSAGTSTNLIKHLKLSSISRPEDKILKNEQKFALRTSNIKHYIIN